MPEPLEAAKMVQCDRSHVSLTKGKPLLECPTTRCRNIMRYTLVISSRGVDVVICRAVPRPTPTIGRTCKRLKVGSRGLQKERSIFCAHSRVLFDTLVCLYLREPHFGGYQRKNKGKPTILGGSPIRGCCVDRFLGYRSQPRGECPPLPLGGWLHNEKKTKLKSICIYIYI